MKTKEELFTEKLNDFIKKYPLSTSGDWQTFVMGLEAGYEITLSPEYKLAEQNALQDKFDEGYSYRMNDEKKLLNI